MEYKITNLPKSELEIEVALPFSELEPAVKRAATLISEQIEIEGFRKGKAPYEIVKQKIGEVKIYEEAAELAIRETYPKILQELFEKNKQEEKEFIPIGRPEVSVLKIAPGNELKYKVKLALLPDITLPGYKSLAEKINKEKKEVLVTENEIDKTLDWIRDSRSQSVAVSRPAEKGDLAEIDFETRLGGVKIENGESRNHPVILGKGKYLPGFEDNLIGLKSGEEKSFTLNAPADWPDKSLAGKSLDFKVNVKSVQERKVPELSDEFAKGLGNFDSVAALRQNIREGIRAEKEDKEKQRRRVGIIEEIAKESRVEIPDLLIESELDKMLQELKSGIEELQMKWEDYLAQIKKSPEELRNAWKEEAEKRVRIALCLRKIGKLEKIEASAEEIEQAITKTLQQYGSPEEARKKIDQEEFKEYTKGILRNEKVFEFLEGEGERVKGKDKF